MLAVVFALAPLFSSAGAPLEGSGSRTTVVKKVQADAAQPLTALRALEASGAFVIRVVDGDPGFVEVTAEQNLVDHVVATQKKDVLVLRTDVDVRSPRGIVVVVHLPRLERVKVNGEITLTARLQAENVDVVAAGASRLTLSGTAKRAKLEIKGAGSVDAADLAVDDAAVDVKGAGDVVVNAGKTVVVEGGGVARVRVKGGAKVDNKAGGAVSVDVEGR